MADVRVRYLVDLVDRGTKALLTQDRAIQRSMAQTDKLHVKLAATATQSAGQQTAAAAKAARSTTGLASATAKTAGATQGLATSTRGATAGVETLNRAQQRALVIGTDLQHVSEAEARALRAQATAARQAAGAADMHAKAQGRQAAAMQRSQATAGRGALSQVGAASAGAAGGVASRATGAAKTAALAGAVGLGVAINQTVKFDKALRNVNSIAQLSERQLDDVSKSIRRLGGETAQAPVTLAEGMYDLVSSGFDARESMSILAKSARAATAGLTTTEVSTKAVAAVLNAYRLPADKAGKVSDQLFRTVDRGVISFEQLAENVGDVLPFASSLGVGLDQVGASISTMTKAGISAPETMTRIKALMQSMLKPGTALSATLKDLGYESGEALIKQKGFQGALETLEATTGGSKEALAELFPNVRALGGALALTGENAKVAGEDLAGMKDASGATSRALEQQSQSLSYQWQRLKAASADLGIEIGTGLKPAMERTIGVASRLVSELAPIWQRDDIDLSTKLTMSSDAASRVLGPVLAEVGRALDRMNLGQRLGQALNAAAPVIAQAAARAGLAAVRGFFQAFHAGDPLTKTMLALFAAHKLGALRAITGAAGRSAGTQFGASAAAGAAPAMATGLRGRMAAIGPQMRSMGKMFLGGMLIAGAVDAVTASDLDFAGRMQNALSTISFGALPSGTETLSKSRADLARIHTELVRVAAQGGNVQQAFLDMTRATNDLKPDEFRRLSDALNPLIDRSGDVREALADLETRFERFSGSPFVSLTNLRSRVEANMETIRESMGTESDHAKNAMGRNIGEAIKVLGKGMDDGRVDTGTAMREIHRLTSVHTGASKEIVSANFRAAADAMKRQMDRGGGATREGLRMIRTLMTKALSAYGISEGAARSLVAKRESPNYGSGGLARGGWINAQGHAGRVPIMAAGGEMLVDRGGRTSRMIPGNPRRDATPIMARPGSAVLTGHGQQLMAAGASLPAAVAAQAPHFARGGFVQGANTSGLTGPTRQFASRMFARGYSVTDAFRPGGSTNHGKGTALDFGDSVNDMRKLGALLIPMRRKFAELFGPGGSWKNGQKIGQIPNHGDHWHVALGGAIGALGGAAAEKIRRVKVRKDLGVVSNVAQGAVDMTRAAAQKKLDAAAATVGAHDGAGQGGAAGKPEVMGWLRKALNITGKFSAGNLAALYGRAMQESGGNPAAQNNWDSNAARGTPSIGLLQTIGPTFRAFALPGMDNIRNPVHNAVAAIRYMYSRYGRIVAANGQGYSQGGMIDAPFVGSYETGGTIPQDGLAHVHQGEVVIPKAMAAGGFVSPHRRLAKLEGLPLDAEIRSGRTLEGFKNVLDNLERVVPAHIASLQKRVREAMAKLRKGGVTPKERERYDQLKDALAAVDEEADRRLGLIGDKVDSAVKAAQDAITGVELGLRTQGVDSGSVAGLAQIVTAQRGLHATLTAQVAAVTRAVARAKREGRTDAGRELGEQLEGLKRDLLEVTADLAEKARAQVLSLAQERLDIVGHFATMGGHQQAQIDAGQRLARTADTPGGMLERAGAIQSSVIPHLRQQISALNAQAHHALTVGAVDVWRQATEQAAGAAVQLTNSLADAADLIRDAGLRAHQDVLDAVAFDLGGAQRQVEALTANQRLARTTDTPAAMVAQAAAITTGVLPQIRAQIAALNAQAWHALSVGSIDVWRQASEQASAASTQLTNSMADAAELIRNAALKIDSDAVEAAGRLVTMRDLGLTNLELRQRLADRFETGGRERADYIREQVLPGLRAELNALTAQEAEARRQGDPILAAQVAEAIAGKQNGLLQAQLDAQEQIRDSAQDLKEYGGTLALQSRGQQFTDFRNTIVGV